MPAAKLQQFLDDKGVRYVSIKHSPAFTAQEIAAEAHIPGREVAKTVMVSLDGELAMAVLPASRQVDLEALKEVTGADQVEICAEADFADEFPECETGAMPPFGNLWEMDVYADESLAADEEIAFNAGTHSELVRLAYEDFVRLVEPEVGRFGVKV